MRPEPAARDRGAPDLILNRFFPRGGNLAIDLATAADVALRYRRIDPGDAARLADCAGRVVSLRHPSLARLVDFGPSGRFGWIEAWEAGQRPDGGVPDPAPSKVALLLAEADAAVRAIGCRLDSRSAEDLWALGRRWVVVPSPGRIVRDEPAVPPEPCGAGSAGTGVAVIWQAHDEYEGLVDTLESGPPVGPRSLVLWAPLGSGVTTLFAMLALAARRRGWVPMTSRLLDSGYVGEPSATVLGTLLRSRHVLVLRDLRRLGPEASAHDGGALARFLSSLDARSGRPHLVLTAVSECRDAGASLAPWPSERLTSLVQNIGVPPPVFARCRDEALARSHGWPGAFVRTVIALTGGDAALAYEGGATGLAMVRETAALPETCGLDHDPALQRARGHIRSAMLLAGRGRHADGVRMLRGAIGALARRGAERDAGRAALELARVLWRRGALDQARDALARAHKHGTKSGDTRGIVAGLVLQGWVEMHGDRLAEAESILLTARTAAEHAAHDDARAAAGVSLALCYRWQDRWAEAARALSLIPTSGESDGRADAVAERSAAPVGVAAPEAGDPVTLPVGCPYMLAGALRALVACGSGDLGVAVRELRHVREGGPDAAMTGTSPGWYAAAVSLRVHGALGDSGAIRRAVAHGITAARASREPLGVLELRVAEAEALLDAGDAKALAAALVRLRRWRRLRIPALHQRRIDRLAGGREAPVCVEPPERPPLARPEAWRVLATCGDAADERELAERVCQCVRRTLGAHAVGAFAAVESAPEVVARAGAAGAEPRTALLGRVLASGLLVGPERTALGVETAVPLRYGGLVIGAVHVRWTAIARPEAASVRAALHAAALVLGPAVRAWLDARAPGAGDRNEDGLLGCSVAMERVREQVRRAASAPFPVLVHGESGTGKELVARMLHRTGPRRGRRFCALNCAAIGDDLFEAELFGHARGAFTGAVTDRAGLFEEADGGTLFLDEVGELSARAQAKLLRAIQENEVRRIGENVNRRVDVRIVAATNRRLEADVADGRFRQDLFFRLDVVRISIPPLRERPEDLPDLAARFWREATTRTGSQAVLAPATLTALARHAWPGNARELQNVLSAVAVRAPRRGPVGPAWLPPAVTGLPPDDPETIGTLADARRQFDERYVRHALARCGGRRAKAAAALGLTRQGLAKLVDRLGLASDSVSQSGSRQSLPE